MVRGSMARDVGDGPSGARRSPGSWRRTALVGVVTAAIAVVASVTAGPVSASPANTSSARTVPDGAVARTAAKPVRLSTTGASKPGVAIDENDTAHVAWLEEPDGGEDDIVYCRLPRGAAACDSTTTLTGPSFDGSRAFGFGPVQVLAPGGGQVDVLGYFCCGPGGRGVLMRWTSGDGGTTFSPGKWIGVAAAEAAIFGPGDHAVTMAFGGSSAPLAASVQVAETDGPEGSPETAAALIGDPDGQQFYTGGVGLIDSATPVTAYTDLEDTFVRVYDATHGTEYNDADHWYPAVRIAGEAQPSIVTGAAGTYLMTYDEYEGNVLRGAYQVRRVSQAADGTLVLGKPFLASDISRSLFGALSADSGGGLTAVWTDEGTTAALRSAYAPQGGAFTRPGTLVDDVRAFNIKVATASDGGGTVVWDDNDHTVWAVGIPAGGVPSDEDPSPEPPAHVGGFNPPGNTKDCKTSLQIKPGVVAAVRGGKCWEQLNGQRWTTNGDVNINGIDFVTPKGSTSVTVDLTKDTVTAGAGVVQKAGPLVFAKDAGTWNVGGETRFEGLEKSNIKLFDFPVMGQASVVFKQDRAEVTANLGLPKPFDLFAGLPVTGQTVLTTTQKKGLILTGITVRAQNLTIGEFGIRNLEITYDAGLSQFAGKAELKLPPGGAWMKVGVAFRKGKLIKLSFVYKDGPPFPFALYPGLWLNGAGFSYDGTDGFAIGGGAHLSIPVPTTVTEHPPIAIQGLGDPPGTGGGFLFKKPASGPTSLQLAAAAEIFGFEVGNATAYFDTTGAFRLDVNVDIGWDRLGVRANGRVDVDPPKGTWYAELSAEACLIVCVGPVKASFSNIGVGACAEIDLWLTTIGIMVGYVWDDGFVAGFSCDMGVFQNPPAPGQAGPNQATLASDGTITLPPHSGDPRQWAVNIAGAGGVPPLVTVRDAGGAVIVASDPAAPREPQENEPVILTPNNASGSTRLLVLQRASLTPTVLRVSSQPGSAARAIARYPASVARDLDARVAGLRAGDPVITVAEQVGTSTVTAAVKAPGKQAKAGTPWTLGFAATNVVEGARTVHFVERSAAGLSRDLGTVTSKNSGTLRFTPTPGPAGRRFIQATVVNSEGIPISTERVASYDAPGWVLPGKATKVKVAVRKGRMTATWRTPSAAPSRPHHWLVAVRTTDGETRLITTTKPSVSVSGLAQKDRARVVVVGVDRFGRRGPTVTAGRA